MSMHHWREFADTISHRSEHAATDTAGASTLNFSDIEKKYFSDMKKIMNIFSMLICIANTKNITIQYFTILLISLRHTN